MEGAGGFHDKGGEGNMRQYRTPNPFPHIWRVNMRIHAAKDRASADGGK